MRQHQMFRRGLGVYRGYIARRVEGVGFGGLGILHQERRIKRKRKFKLKWTLGSDYEGGYNREYSRDCIELAKGAYIHPSWRLVSLVLTIAYILIRQAAFVEGLVLGFRGCLRTHYHH